MLRLNISCAKTHRKKTEVSVKVTVGAKKTKQIIKLTSKERATSRRRDNQYIEIEDDGEDEDEDEVEDEDTGFEDESKTTGR